MAQVLNTEAGSTFLIVRMEKNRELPTEMKTVMRKRMKYSKNEKLNTSPYLLTPILKPSSSITARKKPMTARMNDWESISLVIYPFVAPIAFSVP